MQCKDIDELPVLTFLAGPYDEWPVPGWGNAYGADYPNSVTHAMPAGTPEKLALAKMRAMIRKGVIDGCGCGCRGDFQITDKGRQALTEDRAI